MLENCSKPTHGAGSPVHSSLRPTSWKDMTGALISGQKVSVSLWSFGFFAASPSLESHAATEAVIAGLRT
jgi:hypothetical protein